MQRPSLGPTRKTTLPTGRTKKWNEVSRRAQTKQRQLPCNSPTMAKVREKGSAFHRLLQRLLPCWQPQRRLQRPSSSTNSFSTSSSSSMSSAAVPSPQPGPVNNTIHQNFAFPGPPSNPSSVAEKLYQQMLIVTMFGN